MLGNISANYCQNICDRFFFSKIPWLQHILLNTFRRMLWSMKIFFETHLVLDIKITFRQQKPHCKNFWWKHIQNESWKSCLDYKEQRPMFLVVSRSDVHFGFRHRFFACPIRRASKIAGQNSQAHRKKFVHPCLYQ